MVWLLYGPVTCEGIHVTANTLIPLYSKCIAPPNDQHIYCQYGDDDDGDY